MPCRTRNTVPKFGRQIPGGDDGDARNDIISLPGGDDGDARNDIFRRCPGGDDGDARND